MAKPNTDSYDQQAPTEHNEISVFAPGLRLSPEQQAQLDAYMKNLRQCNYSGPKQLIALFEGSTPQGIMAQYENHTEGVLRFPLTSTPRPRTPESPGPLEEEYPEFGALPPHVPRFAEYPQFQFIRPMVIPGLTPPHVIRAMEERCKQLNDPAFLARISAEVDAVLPPSSRGVAGASDDDSDSDAESGRV
jgi:hypothetical protein